MSDYLIIFFNIRKDNQMILGNDNNYNQISFLGVFFKNMRIKIPNGLTYLKKK
jgi:hypothetical protein